MGLFTSCSSPKLAFHPDLDLNGSRVQNCLPFSSSKDPCLFLPLSCPSFCSSFSQEALFSFSTQGTFSGRLLLSSLKIPTCSLVIINPPTNAGVARNAKFSPWIGNIPWRRKWQPTPVFLPGESHRQRSLEGYSPYRWKESDMSKHMSSSFCTLLR